ncbi:MAG: hypothetical protein DRH37_08220 [Deltaproteobacteria bacterium]|nr:MAG: hypothetical protein DRH37_08220 [Deltaproteobacteria bacterium]
MRDFREKGVGRPYSVAVEIRKFHRIHLTIDFFLIYIHLIGKQRPLKSNPFSSNPARGLCVACLPSGRDRQTRNRSF